MTLVSCPFPYRLHPQAELIEARHEDWAARRGYAHYRDMRFALLAAACYPTADVEVVQLAAATVLWIFADDDYFDEPADPGDRWSRAREALRMARAVQDRARPLPAEAASTTVLLSEVAGMVAAVASPAQYERFAVGVVELLLGEVAGETAPDAAVLGWQDYRLLRHYTTALMPCAVLVDVGARHVGGGGLTDEEWRAFTPQARRAMELVALTNDVYSAPKEAAREVHPLNLPAVLAAEQGSPLARGIELAGQVVAGLYVDYQRGHQRLAGTASMVGRAYLTGLTDFVAGHQYWLDLTPRYAQEFPA